MFTSEHLATRLRSRAEVTHLLSDLSAHFGKIWVIAQIRRPDHLTPSLYSESMKDGGVRSFDEAFVGAFHRHFDQPTFRSNWSGLGAEVVLRPYVERYRAEPDAFFRDWLTVLDRTSGIGLASRAWEIPARPANEALPAPAVAYLRSVNLARSATSVSGAGRRKLIRALRAVPGPPLGQTPSAAAALADKGWELAGLTPQEFDDPLWDEWFAQESGLVSDFGPLSDAEMDDIAAICKKQGAHPQGLGLADRLPRSLSQRVRRSVIRFTRR